MAPSATLPYTRIEPLPIPNEKCVTPKQVCARFALLIAVTGLGVAAGAVAGLSTLPITVLTGVVVGGIVGLACGIALAILIKFPSEAVRYRIATLEQIEKTQSNPTVLQALRNLKDFFARSLLGFLQTYQNHQLHILTTRVTTTIDPQRSDIKKVWRIFLEHLHGTKALNADGQWIPLDFSFEMERLDEKQMALKTEKLETISDKDLEQLIELQNVALGKLYTFSREIMQKGDLFVIRRQGTDQIIAFAFYQIYKEQNLIMGLARHPGAVGMRLGLGLLNALLLFLSVKKEPLFLQVRKSNENAIKLYETFGFEQKKDLPKYYQDPIEDGYQMELNWERALQLLQILNAKSA